MIRKAKPSDIDKLYNLSIDGLKLLKCSHIPCSESDARRVISHSIVAGSAWVTDDVDGALVAYLQPVWFNNKFIVATDLFFYVKDSAVSSGVRLAKEYVKWGLNNADDVALSISFGSDVSRVERLYERLGFDKVGEAYLFRG